MLKSQQPSRQIEGEKDVAEKSPQQPSAKPVDL